MIRMKSNEMAAWIQSLGTDAVMLTISKPHAMALHLKLDESHMQHLISRIITMANQRVFGKHKRFEFMRGLVAVEHSPLHPHYHIIFKRPDAMEFATFKERLSRFSDRICDPNFEFDLSDVPLHERMKKLLSRPCYPAFARLTETHGNTGGYLTKQYAAKYYMLQDRNLSISDDRVELYMDHSNREKESIYA
jgi:hypothetical protein